MTGLNENINNVLFAMVCDFKTEKTHAGMTSS